MSELSPNVRAIASVGQSTLAKHCGLSEPRFPAAVLIISAAGFFKLTGVNMSQNESILQALKGGQAVTQLDAYAKFGCTRLAARIADLRACGHSISMSWVVNNGKRFGSYSMLTKDAA